MRYFVWSEASGMQQELTAFDSEEAANAQGGVVIAESSLNADECKVVADVDATGGWKKFAGLDNFVDFDTADEFDLVYYAKLLGIESKHKGWQAELHAMQGKTVDDGFYERVEELQDSEEGYAAMHELNNEIAKRVRFVALGSYGKTHG